MVDILFEKKRIRKLIKEQKAAFSETELLYLSNAIFTQVEQLKEFQSANTVLAYWSIPGEVQTHSFIAKWYKSKKIALPVIVGETLDIRALSDFNMLIQSNSFGIMEPQTGEFVNPNDIDCAIIPGVAFDEKGNRLGRGKGYYDRLLNQIKGLKVGVGFHFQLTKDIPTDTMDIPVDMVITN